jgi:phosphatidylglycerol lysyltransferase
VAGVDWTLAAGVLYVLLPREYGLGYLPFLGAFLLAQSAGLVSHVPGGLGVFETLIVLLLGPRIPPAEVLGSLLAYRAIYYFTPFAAGVATLAAHELHRQRERVASAAQLAGRWVPGIVPHVLSVTTFAAGVVLLVSGVTPSSHGRLTWLGAVVPLGVIELSHFAGSVAGAGLIVLAWAIARRLDAAYALTATLLGVGIVASLFKGLDWEEALLLATALAALLPARGHFYRRTALTAEPLSPAWIAAVATVVGATVWLGFFSYKHVEYSSELWWRLTLHGDAPRFLRASVGAVGSLLVFGLFRLLGPSAPEPALPGAADLERAARVARASGDVNAYLALLGDKALLFADDGGMLMYGVEGRSWVALGDPIGAPAARTELAWRFHEEADRHGGWTVFYEVGTAHLPLYIDLGLTLLKIGEEATVPLAGFSLDGGARRGLRRARREVEKEGGTFDVAPPKEVPALMPELRRISDAWLAAKSTREKGFSLGFFDEAYLAHFPVALVRVGGRIVAFANVWPGAPGGTVSVDLMRHDDSAPAGVMDYLFIELMLWGKAQGYGRFSLGMAPLSGFETRALAPLWTRAGSLLYRHGEHFYNFQGLRAYKDKFDPVWEPKYIASSGGLKLPRILTNVATLISGGLRGVVSK